MSARTADPVRTGHGQIGSVGSQPNRDTPSIRLAILGGVNRHSFTSFDPSREQAVKISRVPNTSDRVLVVSEVCGGRYGAEGVGD